MQLKSIAVLLIAVMFTIGTAFAQTGETPPTLAGAKTITAAEAKKMMDAGAAVFDVRRKAAFVEGHLPKAKSIAANPGTKKFDPASFGANKGAVIIIHGHGTDGWSAVQAVKDAVEAGFSNVNWMRGGWAEWSAAGLPSES